MDVPQLRRYFWCQNDSNGGTPEQHGYKYRSVKAVITYIKAAMLCFLETVAKTVMIYITAIYPVYSNMVDEQINAARSDASFLMSAKKLYTTKRKQH